MEKLFETLLKESKSLAFWIKNGEKIDIDPKLYHHDLIIEDPELFLDTRTISEFCKKYNLDSIENLKDDWNFQHEMGIIHDKLLELILSRGWIKVRVDGGISVITCYDNTSPKYKKEIIKILLDYSEYFGYDPIMVTDLNEEHRTMVGDIDDILQKLD